MAGFWGFMKTVANALLRPVILIPVILGLLLYWHYIDRDMLDYLFDKAAQVKDLF